MGSGSTPGPQLRYVTAISQAASGYPKAARRSCWGNAHAMSRCGVRQRERNGSALALTPSFMAVPSLADRLSSSALLPVSVNYPHLCCGLILTYVNRRANKEALICPLFNRLWESIYPPSGNHSRRSHWSATFSPRKGRATVRQRPRSALILSVPPERPLDQPTPILPAPIGPAVCRPLTEPSLPRPSEVRLRGCVRRDLRSGCRSRSWAGVVRPSISASAALRLCFSAMVLRSSLRVCPAKQPQAMTRMFPSGQTGIAHDTGCHRHVLWSGG